MKSLKFARLAAIAAVASLSSAAFASDSTTLNVSASVTGTCKLYTSSTGGLLGTGTLSMTFAGIDPTGSSPATQTTDVYYKCTKSTTPAFSVGGTTTSPYNGTLTGSGTAAGNSMTYTISWPAATAGAGFAGNALALTLSGSIPAAQYQAAAAGPYAEPVTISLTP